ncbi:UNVERIFIED_CONTAM: hypothetical protein K2H54_026525 [Gekko kuhli]
MYRGIYTIPNILAEQHPVDIPEDELEEEMLGQCSILTPEPRQDAKQSVLLVLDQYGLVVPHMASLLAS